jgi:hypothetical protein
VLQFYCSLGGVTDDWVSGGWAQDWGHFLPILGFRSKFHLALHGEMRHGLASDFSQLIPAHSMAKSKNAIELCG